MNEFNNFSPPTFPNPLAELQECMRGMVELQKEQAAEVLALRCAVRALCLSHPAPAEALDQYLDQMDALADFLQPDRVSQYGAAMQQYRDTLSAAVARRS